MEKLWVWNMAKLTFSSEMARKHWDELRCRVGKQCYVRIHMGLSENKIPWNPLVHPHFSYIYIYILQWVFLRFSPFSWPPVRWRVIVWRWSQDEQVNIVMGKHVWLVVWNMNFPYIMGRIIHILWNHSQFFKFPYFGNNAGASDGWYMNSLDILMALSMADWW